MKMPPTNQPLKDFRLPHAAGVFGAIRKFDIHTGIDLYCAPGSDVFAMEDSVVVEVGPFTGVGVNMPWWNDTSYLVAKGDSGYILYGEISTSLSPGHALTAGCSLGTVETVLKKDKGLPMTMLHLELYSYWSVWVSWDLQAPKPLNLMDPTPLITQTMKSTQEIK
jgi:hypothetical protein